MEIIIMSNRVTWNLFVVNDKNLEANLLEFKRNNQRKREISNLVSAILAISSFQDNRNLAYIWTSQLSLDTF
jgi:hypothetical protein